VSHQAMPGAIDHIKTDGGSFDKWVPMANRRPTTRCFQRPVAGPELVQKTGYGRQSRRHAGRPGHRQTCKHESSPGSPGRGEKVDNQIARVLADPGLPNRRQIAEFYNTELDLPDQPSSDRISGVDNECERLSFEVTSTRL